MFRTTYGYVVIFLISLTTSFNVLGQIDSLKAINLKLLPLESRQDVLLNIIQQSVLTPDSVIFYGKKLQEITRDKTSEMAFQANLMLGQAYKDKGDYQIATDYLFDAFTIAQSLKNANRISMTSLLLGSIYGRIGDMEKASSYFKAGINNRIEAGTPEDSSYVFIGYNNWGDNYFQNQQYDSAKKYFQKSLKIALPQHYEFAELMLTGNLGMSNLKLGKIDSAEIQLQAAVDYFADKQDELTFITYQIYLAEAYLKKGKLKEAEKLLLDCVDKAEANNYKEQLRDAYEVLTMLYEKANRPELAYDNFKSFISFRDSLRNIENIRRIGDLRTAFEVGQKQTEVDLLTAQKKVQRLVLIGVALLAFIVIIFALVVYQFYQEKAKTNVELASLNRTKDKLFSIISHDLRGPVSSFMGIGRMIKFSVKGQNTDQLLEIADEVDHSVEQLAGLLDNLLNWAMQQQGHFVYSPEKIALNGMCQEVIDNLDIMARAKNIQFKLNVEGEMEIWADKNTAMTIVRNLVSNALKFTPDGGQVKINCEINAQLAIIKVIDTGVGMTAEKVAQLFGNEYKKSTYGTKGEKGLGLGLQLVKEFVDLNNGSILVESELGNGSTFMVELPLYQEGTST